MNRQFTKREAQTANKYIRDIFKLTTNQRNANSDNEMTL